jgi:Bacterial low temperature requirement A protein (LtrA)
VSDLAKADSADSAAAGSPATRLLRDRSGLQRVTNIELFFDLVYVFAITQLSHYLLGHATVPGALQAGLLLVMVWLVSATRSSRSAGACSWWSRCAATRCGPISSASWPGA